MARTKYTVTFPAAKAGDEVTWPNAVKVYADANIDRPLGNGYIETAAGSFTGWSDAASVTFTRAGTSDSVTVTTGSPTGTGAAVPSAASVALSDRGNWATTTAYVVGDVVTQSNNRYICETAHTSGTFATDLAASKWVLTGVATAASSTVTITQQAADYTLALGDAGTDVEGTKASAQTITVPPNASVAFALGTIVNVRQVGAGQITVAAGAGVTLRTPNGAKTAHQYSTLSLIQRVANEWVVAGDATV